MSREGLTEVDGYTALFCELEDIPIQHYDCTFYITDDNLLKIARVLLMYKIIRKVPTLEYLRECCRFRS
jgi:hypothetical protein